MKKQKSSIIKYPVDISHHVGVTLNKGNYESLRIDVGKVVKGVNDEDVEEVVTQLNEDIEVMLDERINHYQNGGVKQDGEKGDTTGKTKKVSRRKEVSLW